MGAVNALPPEFTAASVKLSTAWLSVPVLLVKFASPLYAAEIVWVPAVADTIVHCADPFVMLTLLHRVVPVVVSVKVIDPVGLYEFVVLYWGMLAVKTGCPP